MKYFTFVFSENSSNSNVDFTLTAYFDPCHILGVQETHMALGHHTGMDKQQGKWVTMVRNLYLSKN